MKVEATVLGGFPILAIVGLTRDWVTGRHGFEIDEILTRQNKPARFLEVKMSRKDWDALEDQVADRIRGQS